jgi:hypothetical protein
VLASPFHVAVVSGEMFGESFCCIFHRKHFAVGNLEYLTAIDAFSNVRDKANSPDGLHLAFGNIYSLAGVKAHIRVDGFLRFPQATLVCHNSHFRLKRCAIPSQSISNGSASIRSYSNSGNFRGVGSRERFERLSGVTGSDQHIHADSQASVHNGPDHRRANFTY